jgi:hypothetical protein
MTDRIPSIELQYKFLNKVYNRSDIFEHLPILAFLSSKCDSVTEFGVRTIVSTWAFLYGCPKKMVSVDLVNPMKHNQNIQEVYDLAKANNIDYKFIEASTLDCDIEETDLLFLDTYHEYNQVKGELERHASKVKKYLVFHDTELFGTYGQDFEDDALNTNLKGINPAIDEFLEQNPQWTKKFVYPFSSGLTILEKQ